MRLKNNLDTKKDLLINITGIKDKIQKMPKYISINAISVSLPFISFEIGINDNERNIAKEILIRLRDKRVLTSQECCNSCIENSIQSLLEIRKILVDKQVELQDENSALFLLIEFMLIGIRQFLTWTESMDFNLDRNYYFSALDILRIHLFNSIQEISKIGSSPFKLENWTNLPINFNNNIYIIE